MIAWLTDTLLYTGALILLVLVLRRPVARHFGPQIGYALWALPLLRFVMPPVVLPASYAPGAASETSMATVTVLADPAASAAMPPFEAMASVAQAREPGFWDGWGALLADIAVSVWLAGAAVFLLWRAWTYFRMREWLLEAARPVGEAGKVRLVETPAVSSPVAFGVSDKVVALPVGFMAHENRGARDLAIEHELAHHRGWDLLANMLAQPILALHWFNPLAWMGWRAMRRDQEAACDARVIAARDPGERAAYGQVIASFAAGQRLALAAPMACPVLGEKSIIHRLRSLSMADVTPRRRLTGRVLLAGAALALPLTASISYAHPDSRAPGARAAPKAAITIVDVPDGAEPADRTLHTRVIEKDGQTIILKTAGPVTPEEAEARIKRAQQSMAQAPSLVSTPSQWPTKEQREALAKLRRTMTDQEWSDHTAEWSRHEDEWAKWGEEWAKWGEEFAKQWEEQGKQWAEQAAAAAAVPTPAVAPVAVNVQVPTYAHSYAYACDGKPVRVQRGSSSNVTATANCMKVANSNANARRALEQARSRIEHDRGLSEEIRKEVLESLDREIDRLETRS